MEQRKSVLIVEDDYFQSYVLKTLVKALGYDVAGVADTGEAAIEMAVERKPDLVLMDITLKGEMDGIDAAMKIREATETPHVYITGNTGLEHRQRAAETGAIAFLTKPVDKLVLSDTISKCFK